MSTSRSRRPNGSYVQLPDRTWEYRLSLIVDGRRQRPRFYGSTKAEALAEAESYKARLRDGLPADVADMRLGDYLDEWMRGLVRAPGTIKLYESLIRIQMKPRLGRARLTELEAPALRSWQRSLLDGGCSPSQANLALTVLSAALHDAERDGLVSRNVASLVRRLPVTRRERRLLSPEQVRAFMDATAETRYGPLYVTAIGLGLRMGELLGLCWDDFEDGYVRVSKQLGRYGAGITPTKTGDRGRRVLPVPGFVADALEHQRERQRFDRLTAGIAWVDTPPYDLVFRSPEGRPVVWGTLDRAFQRHREAAGLPSGLTFHDLRHACATLLLSQGTDMRTVQMILGHTSMRTTEIYAHVLPGLMDDAVRKLDDLLG